MMESYMVWVTVNIGMVTNTKDTLKYELPTWRRRNAFFIRSSLQRTVEE